MHYSAMRHGKLFFDTYVKQKPKARILDLGAQDVNGSLRSLAPAGCDYVGADFIEAKGVDVVLTDAYALPFADESFDVCVSSSCFEHADFFWLAFNEVLRILKPDGLFYLNAPSNGHFHRYPVDCWRFYPDSGSALERWGRRSGYSVALLENFTGTRQHGPWNDFIGVFVKQESAALAYPDRILDSYRDFTNGMIRGREEILNFKQRAEEVRKGILPRKLARLFRRKDKKFDPNE